MPKGVAAEIVHKIVVDEHPIEGCVESHEDRYNIPGNSFFQPAFKLLQGLGWLSAIFLQFLHGKAMHLR